MRVGLAIIYQQRTHCKLGLNQENMVNLALGSMHNARFKMVSYMKLKNIVT